MELISMKVFAYYRVSSSLQEEKSTQENQENDMKKYLSKNKEIQVKEWLSDLAMTGFNDNRPKYQEMLDRIDEVDGILIFEKSRITRSLEDGLKLMFYLMKKNKVLIESLSGKITSFNTSEEQLISMIGFWQADYAGKMIKTNQKLGIARKIEKTGSWGRKKVKINWKKYEILLEKLGNNKSAVARTMGISPVTLWRRLKEEQAQKDEENSEIENDNENRLFPKCYDRINDICLKGKSSGTGSPLDKWCPSCGYYQFINLDPNIYCKKHGTILRNKKCITCEVDYNGNKD